jgi:hypothetical protein
LIGENPAAVTVTVYVAGGICRNWYTPSWPEVTVRANPVCGSLSFTVAPGSTAPLGSLITPCSEVVDCAAARELSRLKSSERTASLMQCRMHAPWIFAYTWDGQKELKRTL